MAKRKRTKLFDRVEIENERIVHMADHEILLSFLDDSGAVAFRDWWDEKGLRQFSEWLGCNGFEE